MTEQSAGRGTSEVRIAWPTHCASGLSVERYVWFDWFCFPQYRQLRGAINSRVYVHECHGRVGSTLLEVPGPIVGHKMGCVELTVSFSSFSAEKYQRTFKQATATSGSLLINMLIILCTICENLTQNES